MTSGKKLVIDHVNKIKYEKYEEFSQSIFSEVYEKAARYVREIIQDNRTMIKDKDVSKLICSQELFHNMIPFLGDRGMGKSSAMLSFALFLKKYNQIDELLPQYTLCEDRIHFYLLPRIDAAMMVKGENLLDIVLASMWKTFEDNQSLENNYEDVKKKFSNVKKSYELYNDTISGREMRSMASVRDLKELSRCLNLAQDFKELVKSFLPCVLKKQYENSFLVLILDDLDTATENVYTVLEQIRLFLMIPNVIVLVTADMGRLYLECSKYFMKKLIVEKETSIQEKKQIRGYAQSYLSKILPNNKRIYMPDMNIDNEREYEIEFQKKEKCSETVKDVQNIKKKLYQFIYQYTHIMLYPNKRVNAVLRYRSLRDVVNVLHMLKSIGQLADEQTRTEETIQWLFTRMEEYIQNGQDTNIFYYLRSAMSTQFVYLNSAVSEFRDISNRLVGGNNSIRNQHDSTFDYEIMLRLLHELSNLTDRYEPLNEIGDALIALYSAKLTQFYLEQGTENFFKKVRIERIFHSVAQPSEEEDDFSLFGYLDDQKTTERTLVDRVQIGSLWIYFDNTKTFSEWLSQNRDSVFDVFAMAFLCGSNLWDKGHASYAKYTLENLTLGSDLADPSEDEMDVCIFTLEGDYAEATVDHLFFNMVQFDNCLSGFLDNLWQAYLKKYGTEKQGELADCMKLFDFDSYQKWKQQYQVKTLIDILPLESVDIMYEISTAIRNLTPVGKEGNMTLNVIESINKQVEEVQRILKDADIFYKNEEKGYSYRIEEFLKEYPIIDRARTKAKKMDNTLEDVNG